MAYQKTITKKDRLLFQKRLGDFEIGKRKKLDIEFEKKIIKIKPAPDFLELGGKFKPKKKRKVLRAGEY